MYEAAERLNPDHVVSTNGYICNSNERLYRHQSNPQSQSCNLSYHLLNCEYNPLLLTYRFLETGIQNYDRAMIREAIHIELARWKETPDSILLNNFEDSEKGP